MSQTPVTDALWEQYFANATWAKCTEFIDLARGFERDAARWRALRDSGLVSIRVGGQEFEGISNMDAWADAHFAQCGPQLHAEGDK